MTVHLDREELDRIAGQGGDDIMELLSAHLEHASREVFIQGLVNLQSDTWKRASPRLGGEQVEV